MSTTVWIVIPAYNEGQVIAAVIESLRGAGFSHILVVDDGSTDDTFLRAKRTGATVLRHSINRGKGAAVKTGIMAALRLGASAVVTVDGDGQHDPRDVKGLALALSKGYDVVLGTRSKGRDMPIVRRWANMVGNFMTWLMYGVWVSDSQCGLRAYSRKALATMSLMNDRYEYDSEVIREIGRHRLRSAQKPIRTRYTEYSLGKKDKQSFTNGLRTLLHMFVSS